MPTISTISPSTFDDGKSVTLTGSGFGASQGQVLIGGVAQNVNTWSDDEITFTTVRGSQSLGACRVDVVRSAGLSGGTAALGWSAASLSDGETLTITTDGTYNFGATGPTVAIYDDFASGVAGQSVPTSSAAIGGWSSQGGSPLLYATGGRDGNACASIYNSTYTPTSANTARVRQNIIDFPSTSEVFACWALNWGSATGSGTPSTWPNSSHLKLIWLANGSAVGTNDGNDIVLYSHNGSGGVIVGGNDSQQYAYFNNANAGDLTNFNFSGWNVYQCWLKGGANPTANASTIYGEFSNANHKGSETITNKNVFSSSDGNISRAYIVGWWGNLTANDVGFNPRLDDVYVATGAGAAARVMLGDASTWSACREVWIAPPTAWASNSISCRIPSTGGAVIGKYLYIFNASNALLNSTGLGL